MKKKILFGCAVFLLLFQCAYFNTFYNAETSFKEAQSIHQKVLRNHPDSLVVEPPAEARKNYERVIEKSYKVIDVYRNEKKWHDDAFFLMAKSYYYNKNMPRAIARLQHLQQEYPSSPFIPESYLYLAKSYIVSEELNKAEETLEMILEKYPELDNNQEVTLLLVEIAIGRGGKAQAIDLLEKSYESTNSEGKKLDLLLRMAELQIELQQYNKAIKLLKSASRKKDLPLHLYRIDRALLTCFMETDSLEKALEQINDMASNKLYSSHLAEILLQKGIILKRLGRIDQALAIFTSLAEEKDSTSMIQDSSSISAKACLELALLYQKDKGDYHEAEEYYERAGTSRDSIIMDKASKRLTALRRLKQLRSPPDPSDTIIDSVPAGDVRLYIIGELFRFELDEPDSAYRQFNALVSDTKTDTVLVPKALYAVFDLALHEMSDSVRADSLYKVMLERYPESEYTRRAQQEMELPVTIKTRRILAEEAFCRAEKLYYKEEKPKAAIKAFYKIYREYPELEIAPKSLLAAAWLTDNVLQKKKTAKTLYERLCEKYPESQHCTQEAKPRIKVVLDTLAALGRLKAGKSNHVSNETSRDKNEAGSNKAEKDVPKQQPVSKEDMQNPADIRDSTIQNETLHETNSVQSEYPGAAEEEEASLAPGEEELKNVEE